MQTSAQVEPRLRAVPADRALGVDPDSVATRAQTLGHDGTVYPKGTAVPQRADFNTLDNPFFWTARPGRDKFKDVPAAGLHFVVFNPTSDDFRRARLAMDGVMPDGTKLGFETGSSGRGFNSVLETTHRQNFLVPPRATARSRSPSFAAEEFAPGLNPGPRAGYFRRVGCRHTRDACARSTSMSRQRRTCVRNRILIASAIGAVALLAAGAVAIAGPNTSSTASALPKTCGPLFYKGCG